MLTKRGSVLQSPALEHIRCAAHDVLPAGDNWRSCLDLPLLYGHRTLGSRVTHAGNPGFALVDVRQQIHQAHGPLHPLPRRFRVPACLHPLRLFPRPYQGLRRHDPQCGKSFFFFTFRCQLLRAVPPSLHHSFVSCLLPPSRIKRSPKIRLPLPFSLFYYYCYCYYYFFFRFYKKPLSLLSNSFLLFPHRCPNPPHVTCSVLSSLPPSLLSFV